MSNERDIFLQAVEFDSVEARSEFLDESCGGDVALRSRVEGLLRSHDDAGSFLEHPAMEPANTLAGEGSTAGSPYVERTELYDTDLDRGLDFLEPCDTPGRLGLLGPYEVIEVVGRGGMGIVLKAHDPLLNRIVAIKTLAPEYANNPTARRRFAREAQAAAAVAHPHVVTIHAVEPNGPIPYLVMELVQGQSLRDKIDLVGSLELREILRIGEQIARGLAAAHGQGLIHRDVKPGNVLLENGVERVKLTDFGLARATDDVAITRTGDIAGTPQYMSPEQAEGRAVDVRSDLFSLGSVLYAMCTGRPPFRGETAVAVLRKVCDTEPRAIREINPDVPEWLVDVIDHLLAKDPEHRFQSANEVARVLGEHLAELQNPSGSGNRPRFERRLPTRRAGSPRRWITAVIAIFAVCGAVGLTEATGVTKFSPTIVRLFSGSGTIVVEVDDPNVSVSLEGEELVITGAGAKEIRVPAGEHTLVATKDGKPVSREIVRVDRGGRQVVRITVEPTENPLAPKSDDVETADNEPADSQQRIVISIREGENGPEFVLDGQVVPLGKLEEQLQELVGPRPERNFSLELHQDENVKFSSADEVQLVRKLRSVFGEKIVESIFAPRREAELSKRRLAFKQIGLAFHNHHDVYRTFPPTAKIESNFDDEGRPLLSWRVHLLPFLGEAALYERFHLDEPWDSEHNEPLLAEMPDVFRTTGEPTKTTLLMVVGEGTAYEGRAGLALKELLDGTANTALVVDAGAERAVPWTRPEDLPFDAEDPIRAFGTPEFGDEYVILMADGRVDAIARDVAPESLRALFTRAGRDRFDEKAKRTTPIEPVPTVSKSRLFEGHTFKIFEVRFTPDGKQSVSASSDETVRVWDVATGRELRRFTEHESSVYGLAISPDGELVASSDDDGVVLVWKRETGEVVLRWSEYGGRVTTLAFSPEGNRLAIGGRGNGRVDVITVPKGELAWQKTVTRGSITGVAYSPDGHRLAVTTSNGRLDQFEAGTGVGFAGERLDLGGLANVVFSPDNRLLAVQASSGKVLVYHRRSQRPILELSMAGRGLGLSFAKRGAVLVTGTERVLQLWDMGSGRQLARIEAVTNCMQHLAVSPDSQYVLTGGGEYRTESSTGETRYEADGDYALHLRSLPSFEPTLVREIPADRATLAGIELLDRWIGRLEDPRWNREKPFGDLDGDEARALAELRTIDEDTLAAAVNKMTDRLAGSDVARERLLLVLEDLHAVVPDDADARTLATLFVDELRKLPPPRRAEDASPQSAVEEPRRRAIAFLRGEQRKDGRWVLESGPYDEGLTALVALALLRSGVPADDADVANAVNSIENEDPSLVYDAAVRTVLLCELDPVRHRARIQTLVDRLCDAQIIQGPNAGTWRYQLVRPENVQGDHSNTGYAVWALHVAATKANAKVDEKVWTRIRDHFLKCQLEDGSWSYVANIPKGTGSMTAAGLYCLATARRQLGDEPADPDAEDRPEDRALAWLGKRVTAEAIGRNPESTSWNLYWLDQLRKAAEVEGFDRVGEVDWREAGRDCLLSSQAGNGSWADTPDNVSGRVISTAFALLFLADREPGGEKPESN